MAGVSVNKFGEMEGVIHFDDNKVNLLQELGSGAFGTVYQGTTKDGSDAAFKKLHTDTTYRRQKVSSETWNWYRLKRKRLGDANPHIVGTIDVRRSHGVMWIVMEFCQLGDLNKFFCNHFHLIQPLERKVGIMKQIANGVAFLHSEGIVHRDIKPQNILLQAAYSNVVVKLADFGLCKILDPGNESSTMTSDVGTLCFKAPEFWSTEVRYHSNVDVYSSGLTFLAMLQAQPGGLLRPMAEGTTSDLARQPIGLAARSCNDIKIVVPKREDTPEVRYVKILIGRMTGTDPDNRPSAAEVEQELPPYQPEQEVPVPRDDGTSTSADVSAMERDSDGFSDDGVTLLHCQCGRVFCPNFRCHHESPDSMCSKLFALKCEQQTNRVSSGRRGQKSGKSRLFRLKSRKKVGILWPKK